MSKKKQNEETKLYHYHPVTGEYMGESLARLDPIGKKPLIPANATVEVANFDKMAKNKNIVFKDGKWVIVSDYRGQKFYKADGTPVEIKEIDQNPVSTWSNKKPDPLPKTNEQIKIAIKQEAANRIATSGHDWMALRQVTTNKKVPSNIVDYAAAVRLASDELERLHPVNFVDDKYWPDKI